MDAVVDYIDICVRILVTQFCADIMLRGYNILWEYLKYKNHYLQEDCFRTIFYRGYHFNTATIVVYLSVVAIVIIRISCNKEIPSLFPPPYFFLFMPLWWLHYWAQMDRSTLDYAKFIRGNHGLDSASSMAANFFHGYLKLILPAYTNNSGIRERIEHYEQVQDVRFATKRLVILVPSQLFIKSKFESPYLEKAEPLSKVYCNRAGVFRPYKNDVYRFTKPINNRFYYLSLEGATPILTFFETLNFPLTSTKEIKEMKREILLKFYKCLRKLVYDWPETEEEIELIFYSEYKPNGQKQDLGEMLFNHYESLITSKELLNSNEPIQCASNCNNG